MKISKAASLKIKRFVNKSVVFGKKVTSQKVVDEIDLDCSTETVRRHLNKNNFKYKKAVQ